MEYKEANVDIEGIIKDMKYRGVPKDFIANDIFMNSNYYLSNITYFIFSQIKIWMPL